eukprot:XP_011430675.1 PREDICTED: uncharacterized protein LOC105330600 [Crassostrea gigas]
MAEDDMPGCSKCQQKHHLAPVPESGQPLIDQPCMSCKKLRKTFEEVPDCHKRPLFNRSISCPVQGAIVSYLPEDGKLLNDFLSERESDDVITQPSDTKISISEEKEPLPRQPACRAKRQTIFNVCMCILLAVLIIICVITFVAHSGRSTGEGNDRHQPQAAVNSDLPRNATVAPHVHHRHCFSRTLLALDVSRLEQRDPDKPTNFVPFKIIASSDEIVSLSADRRTVIFNKPGEYHVDVEFIMDTYSMDGLQDNRPQQQNLCLNIPGRAQVCRPLILGRHMRLTQRVNAEVSVDSGQNLSVFVHNFKMLFPDPHLNTLKITTRHC